MLKLPYPLLSGEKQVIQGKQRQTEEQIDQVDLNTHLFTIEDIALARLLVKFKKPLNVTDGEVVVPKEGQQSVRNILATMHPTAETLKDIWITKESTAFLTQANVKA